MTLELLQRPLAVATDRQSLIPPDAIHNVGDGDFAAIAAEFLAYFIKVGGLSPTDRVLDIGCGTGRMAYGLSSYLDPVSGHYTGFDPSRDGAEWCREAYRDYANFDFSWIDVRNELYNPDGRIDPVEIVFPGTPAGRFDFFIMTSVLTHLYEHEIHAYLSKIRACASSKATVFATAYLHTGGKPVPGPTRHLNFNVFGTREPRRWHVAGIPPLSAVCYHEAMMEELFTDALGRKPVIHPGRWRNGPGPWFQDLIIA